MCGMLACVGVLTILGYVCAFDGFLLKFLLLSGCPPHYCVSLQRTRHNAGQVSLLAGACRIDTLQTTDHV